MNQNAKVAVCSRSFSRNKILRSELSKHYKNITFNDDGLQLKGDVLIEYLKGHDKAIVALEIIDDHVLENLPTLKVISKYGVGMDMIDMNAMRSHNVRLGWTGGVNKRSVSELVISFAISLLRHVPAAQREVLSGTWRQHVGGQLSGRTVGIIGCGHIGKDLVPLLHAFGCTVLVNDIRDYSDFYSKHKIKAVSLDELLIESDIVTLHLPLDSSTRNILNEKRLGLMKPTAILINAARGGLIDEKEVKKMLIEKRLAAAAFDVFTIEPPEDNELIQLPNFLVSPHIGGSSEEAILAMGRAAINGLEVNEIPGPEFD